MGLNLLNFMNWMIWSFLLMYSCEFGTCSTVELFYFKFLPALKVLSYARKSCSLSNICSFLFNFIGNLFELADLFFCVDQKSGPSEFFQCLVSAEVCLMSICSLFVLLLTDKHYFIFYTIISIKFDSSIIESNQLSGFARVNLKVHSPFCFDLIRFRSS